MCVWERGWKSERIDRELIGNYYYTIIIVSGMMEN